MHGTYNLSVHVNSNFYTVQYCIICPCTLQIVLIGSLCFFGFDIPVHYTISIMWYLYLSWSLVYKIESIYDWLMSFSKKKYISCENNFKFKWESSNNLLQASELWFLWDSGDFEGGSKIYVLSFDFGPGVSMFCGYKCWCLSGWFKEGGVSYQILDLCNGFIKKEKIFVMGFWWQVEGEEGSGGLRQWWRERC